jgi:hypothetical protein
MMRGGKHSATVVSEFELRYRDLAGAIHRKAFTVWGKHAERKQMEESGCNAQACFCHGAVGQQRRRFLSPCLKRIFP